MDTWTVMKRWLKTETNRCAAFLAIPEPTGQTPDLAKDARTSGMTHNQLAEIESTIGRIEEGMQRWRAARALLARRMTSLQAFTRAAELAEFRNAVSERLQATTEASAPDLSAEHKRMLQLAAHKQLALEWDSTQNWDAVADRQVLKLASKFQRNIVAFNHALALKPKWLDEWKQIAQRHIRRPEHEDWDDLILGEIVEALQLDWTDTVDPNAVADTIARRAAARLRKKAKLEREAIEQKRRDPSAPTAVPSPEELVATPEERAEIEARMEALCEKDRVIIAAYLSCGSTRGAARHLGIPISTYRRRFWEVVEKLTPD